VAASATVESATVERATVETATLQIWLIIINVGLRHFMIMLLIMVYVL
jgi:hypothetical protein